MTEVLKKGENVSLSKITPSLNEIIISIQWLKKITDSTKFEIDSSAFLLTVENKVRNDADFIFYNQPNSVENSVMLKNQLFKVSLNKLAIDIHKISFVLTLHDAKLKQQNFSMLEQMSIEVFNFADKQKVVSYCLTEMGYETTLVLGLLYRHNQEWKFRAIGQGYQAGLAILAKNFGVDVANEPVQSLPEQQLIDAEPQSKKHKMQSKIESLSKNNLAKEKAVQDLDIHNTDIMTQQQYYEPIVQWFKQKSFIAEVNPDAMDTSGFFDEVAVTLGDNYDILKIISNTIKRRQHNKNRAYIDLSNYSSQEIGRLKNFCKQLYDYSFVAKYFYNSAEKKIILHLQTAVKIINFFNGEWFEWYAFMKIATLCHQKNIQFSCTRNMIIYLPDENKYELDVFFMINKLPLFIECKSGEYREYIDKYSRLRRKLFIQKPYFLFLTLGVDDEHTKGLTAMFDITFVNEKNLVDYFVETFLENV